MIVKLLTEHHFEFLSITGGCRGSSESTLVKCQIVGNHMSQLIYVSEELRIVHDRLSCCIFMPSRQRTRLSPD